MTRREARQAVLGHLLSDLPGACLQAGIESPVRFELYLRPQPVAAFPWVAVVADRSDLAYLSLRIAEGARDDLLLIVRWEDILSEADLAAGLPDTIADVLQTSLESLAPLPDAEAEPRQVEWLQNPHDVRHIAVSVRLMITRR